MRMCVQQCIYLDDELLLDEEDELEEEELLCITQHQSGMHVSYCLFS
jgi:hypothetical protein